MKSSQAISTFTRFTYIQYILHTLKYTYYIGTQKHYLNIHAYIHTYIHIRNTYIYSTIHTYLPIQYIHTYMHTYLLTNRTNLIGAPLIKVYVHTFILTYAYIHTFDISQAPNPEELQAELRDKIANLYLFDCLRANKSTSAWGRSAQHILLHTYIPTYIHTSYKHTGTVCHFVQDCHFVHTVSIHTYIHT